MTPVSLFKCLSDETRLRCMALLFKEGKLCVFELTHALNLLQPKISRHLAMLRQCNLLLDSREGQWVYYHIIPDLAPWIIDILEISVKQPNKQQHHDDTDRLQSMSGRLEKSCCR